MKGKNNNWQVQQLRARLEANLAVRLRFLLDERKMTYREAARFTTITTNSFWAYLNKVRFPNGVHLVLLATRFEVSVDWLLGLKEER